MVLGEPWTVLAVSDGGVCSFDRGKTAAAAGIAGANGRLHVCRSNAGVHARGGDRGLGDEDLVGRGRTGTHRYRGQGAPGRARGAEHKVTKAVQLISMDGQPCCFLVGGGRRQATGRGGLAMVLREEGEVAVGTKRQGSAGAKQRGRGGSTGAPSEKDERGEGDPGAGLTEEEVERREGEREKDGDERDQRKMGIEER